MGGRWGGCCGSIFGSCGSIVRKFRHLLEGNGVGKVLLKAMSADLQEI